MHFVIVVVKIQSNVEWWYISVGRPNCTYWCDYCRMFKSPKKLVWPFPIIYVGPPPKVDNVERSTLCLLQPMNCTFVLKIIELLFMLKYVISHFGANVSGKIEAIHKFGRFYLIDPIIIAQRYGRIFMLVLWEPCGIEGTSISIRGTSMAGINERV